MKLTARTISLATSDYRPFFQAGTALTALTDKTNLAPVIRRLTNSWMAASLLSRLPQMLIVDWLTLTADRAVANKMRGADLLLVVKPMTNPSAAAGRGYRVVRERLRANRPDELLTIWNDVAAAIGRDCARRWSPEAWDILTTTPGFQHFVAALQEMAYITLYDAHQECIRGLLAVHKRLPDFDLKGSLNTHLGSIVPGQVVDKLRSPAVTNIRLIATSLSHNGGRPNNPLRQALAGDPTIVRVGGDGVLVIEPTDVSGAYAVLEPALRDLIHAFPKARGGGAGPSRAHFTADWDPTSYASFTDPAWADEMLAAVNGTAMEQPTVQLAEGMVRADLVHRIPWLAIDFFRQMLVTYNEVDNPLGSGLKEFVARVADLCRATAGERSLVDATVGTMMENLARTAPGREVDSHSVALTIWNSYRRLATDEAARDEDREEARVMGLAARVAQQMSYCLQVFAFERFLRDVNDVTGGPQQPKREDLVGHLLSLARDNDRAAMRAVLHHHEIDRCFTVRDLFRHYGGRAVASAPDTGLELDSDGRVTVLPGDVRRLTERLSRTVREVVYGLAVPRLSGFTGLVST